MAGHIEDALLGRGSRIVSCTPTKALYTPGGHCSVRYRLEVHGPHRNQVLRPLVSAHLFDGARGEIESAHRRVSQLAALANGAGETEVFRVQVASLRMLPMVAHAFPIDPALPTLIRAGDPQSVAEALRTALPPGFALDGCRVEVAHYPRSARCLLRYEVRGTLAGQADERTLYGKVGTRHHPLVGRALSALALASRDRGLPLRVPRLLTYRPELDLALYDEVPGVARMGELVRGWARGAPGATAGALGEAIDRCALAAAALHAADVQTERIRTLGGELEALRVSISVLDRASPRLAALLGEWAGDVERGAGTVPQPIRLAHGDFTHSQILFDGDAMGVVDFDTITMAEPALDLGRFLAYLRYAIRKAERSTAPGASSPLAEDLCDRFLQTYVAAAPEALDAAAVRDRVRTYESVTLLHMAAKSWRQLKPVRTANVLSLLEERER
jgi:hypothetical protein